MGVKLSTIANEQVTANMFAIKSKFPKEIIEKAISEVIGENDISEHMKGDIQKCLEDGSSHLITE